MTYLPEWHPEGGSLVTLSRDELGRMLGVKIGGETKVDENSTYNQTAVLCSAQAKIHALPAPSSASLESSRWLGTCT